MARIQITFKTLFALAFSLTLMGFGIYSGLRLQEMPAIAGLPPGKELFEQTRLQYLVTAALAVVGILTGALIGLRIGEGITHAGDSIAEMKPADKLAAFAGVILGGLVSLPAYVVFFQVKMPLFFQLGFSALATVICVYLGFVATTSMKSELFTMLSRGGAALTSAETAEQHPKRNCKILDTNVIIDGRITDICHAGFIEGTLYVPGFVLEELQHIADSSDALKRARGRRGLDILNGMQKEFPLVVRSWDKALDRSANYDEVDTRLVKLAKALDGIIVTNDFNLNKVAALQGVTVLNINELANALKPVVLPGELMRVGIVKEGKEADQGVAYLEDGTMIVVENGRRFINETLHVMVTSVLQTAAGKMIFARVRDDEGDQDDYNGSTGARGRRRPTR